MKDATSFLCPLLLLVCISAVLDCSSDFWLPCGYSWRKTLFLGSWFLRLSFLSTVAIAGLGFFFESVFFFLFGLLWFVGLFVCFPNFTLFSGLGQHDKVIMNTDLATRALQHREHVSLWWNVLWKMFFIKPVLLPFQHSLNRPYVFFNPIFYMVWYMKRSQKAVFY